MRRGRQEIVVVGDRILVSPEEGEVRTKVGLILPPGALDKEAVQGGRVVARGPGTALPPPDLDEEMWRQPVAAPRYLPMQVEVGDYAVFFRKAAVEITFQEVRYLVVSQGAVLVVVRDRETDVPDSLPEDL